MHHSRDLEDLAAEARHRRRRYDLYKAKLYAGRPTSDSRLRELQRSSELAEARLAAAKAGAAGTQPQRPD